MAVSHDIATNSTNALIIGLRDEEIEILVDTLKVSKDKIPFYVLLPSILMDRAVDVLCTDAEARRNRLIQIAQTTGLHAVNRFGSIATQHNEQEEILDLKIVTHGLTSLSDACAGIDAVCTTQNLFIDAISTLERNIMRARDPKEGDDTIVSGSSNQRLKFIGHLLRGIENKVRYTKASAQGQVQTVRLLFRHPRSVLFFEANFRPLPDVQSYQSKRQSSKYGSHGTIPPNCGRESQNRPPNTEGQYRYAHHSCCDYDLSPGNFHCGS
jgi:hypothetical protein